MEELMVALLLMAGAGDGQLPQPQEPVPSVDAIAARLVKGRLVIEQVRFQPADEAFAEGAWPWLLQVARAVNRVPGRFVVRVRDEVPPRPADTVLSRRRSMAAYRALLVAGSNPAHLVAPDDRNAPRSSAPPVSRGLARIELLRIE